MTTIILLVAYLIPLIGLIASFPMLWYHPIETTKLIGAAWITLFLIVYTINRTLKVNRDYLLSYKEEKIASRHGLFFWAPSTSIYISGGATLWQVFTTIWAIYLVYRGLWMYLPIPAITYFLCIYVRFSCHPIFVATEECRRDKGKSDFQDSQMKLFLLKAIYEKLHGKDERDKISPH